MTAESDRQLPAGNEIFLDHVGYFAADLGVAGGQLERLGFQVSPVNLQQNPDAGGVLRPSGTSNRLAMLRRGFIEVLAVTHDTPLAERVKEALRRYAGLHLIALSHDDLAAQRARLVAAGFKMHDTVNLRRQTQTPDGPREVSWSVLRPEAGALPEGRVQYVKCHTPDAVWPPALTRHPNKADAVTDMLLCSNDRRASAERLGRYAARKPEHEGARSTLALDRGRLVFVEPGEAAKFLPGFAAPDLPFMAGQAIRSADLAATRDALARNGMKPVVDRGDLVCVGPSDALGGYLLFHAAKVDDPWGTLATARRINAPASPAGASAAPRRWRRPIFTGCDMPATAEVLESQRLNRFPRSCFKTRRLVWLGSA